MQDFFHQQYGGCGDGWTFLLYTLCHCYSRAPKKLAIFPWLGKHCPFLFLSFWDQNGDILRSFPNAFSAMKQYGWSTILFFLWRSVATSCCLPSRPWTPGCVSDWVVVGDVLQDSRDKKNLHGYSFCISTWKIQQFLISCHVVLESILDQLSPKQMALPKQGPLHRFINHYKRTDGSSEWAAPSILMLM